MIGKSLKSCVLTLRRMITLTRQFWYNSEWIQSPWHISKGLKKYISIYFYIFHNSLYFLMKMCDMYFFEFQTYFCSVLKHLLIFYFTLWSIHFVLSDKYVYSEYKLEYTSFIYLIPFWCIWSNINSNVLNTIVSK